MFAMVTATCTHFVLNTRFISDEIKRMARCLDLILTCFYLFFVVKCCAQTRVCKTSSTPNNTKKQMQHRITKYNGMLQLKRESGFLNFKSGFNS